MDKLPIDVEVDRSGGAIDSDSKMVGCLHLLLDIGDFQLVDDLFIRAYPADAFFGPVQPRRQKCFFAHDPKVEVVLDDVVDANLHVLLVLDWVAMIDVVGIPVVEYSFDVGP